MQDDMQGDVLNGTLDDMQEEILNVDTLNMQDDMLVERYIFEAGFQPLYKGYFYLTRAVELMVQRRRTLGEIYDIIADERGISASTVEKSISTVAKDWKKRGGKLTSKNRTVDIVAILAAKVRLDM